MNYRVVLLFSILIIVIGVFGLLTNNKDDKKDLITNPTNVISDKKVYVLLAKAKENLAIGALLNNKDYILSHQELPESSPLVKNNLSPLSSIEGFLLKNNLEKNAYITRKMIAEPESPDFIKFNLESGKMIYTFEIGKKNQYLLNLFHPGDHVSLQLRTVESSNSNQINNPDHISIKSNNSSTNNNQDYVLTKIIPDIQIVSIRKYSNEESSKINKNNKNYMLGYIDVSIKVSDLETIFMTEKSGDLILVPMKGSSQENKLSTIMPKLKVIKEFKRVTQLKRIFFYQRCIKLIFFVFGSLTLFGSANAANTGDLFMSEGESLVIKKKQNIDTVFVSNPAVADYKIVDHNTVIIYAKAEGTSEFTFFEPNQNISYHATVMVDNIIKVVSDKIRMLYPGSQVRIEKIGKSYLLTGMAPTEEVRDNIVRMVGEAIQSPKSNDKDTVSLRLGMSDKGDTSETTENVNSSLTNKVYERLINQIQLPVSNQVNVKLSIVEVSKEFKDNIGFEWANLGTFSFHKFNFTADRITHLVNALQDDSIARVLAEPNLSVLSGESASFLVGGEIPYVKDRDASNRASIDFKEFGIKLSVTAKVNENKRIKVMLSEEISSVIGNTKAEEFTMPSLKKRRANTTVELADGESFVLGGLINQEEQEGLQKVPFIGDIPILGSFFRHTKTNNRSIELIVVATVNLVKPIPSKEITLPDFMKTPSIARFLNLSVIKNISQKKEAEEFLGKGGFIQ